MTMPTLCQNGLSGSRVLHLLELGRAPLSRSRQTGASRASFSTSRCVRPIQCIYILVRGLRLRRFATVLDFIFDFKTLMDKRWPVLNNYLETFVLVFSTIIGRSRQNVLEISFEQGSLNQC